MVYIVKFFNPYYFKLFVAWAHFRRYSYELSESTDLAGFFLYYNIYNFLLP